MKQRESKTLWVMMKRRRRLAPVNYLWQEQQQRIVSFLESPINDWSSTHIERTLTLSSLFSLFSFVFHFLLSRFQWRLLHPVLCGDSLLRRVNCPLSSLVNEDKRRSLSVNRERTKHLFVFENEQITSQYLIDKKHKWSNHSFRWIHSFDTLSVSSSSPRLLLQVNLQHSTKEIFLINVHSRSIQFPRTSILHFPMPSNSFSLLLDPRRVDLVFSFVHRFVSLDDIWPVTMNIQSMEINPIQEWVIFSPVKIKSSFQEFFDL